MVFGWHMETEQNPTGGIRQKHGINWNIVILLGIVVFGLVGYGVVHSISEKNALEKQRIEQSAQLEREKLQQEKDLQEAKLQADEKADLIKIEAEKEAAKLKADQEAQTSLNAKTEQYRKECSQEKLKLAAMCDKNINYECASTDIDCVQRVYLQNPFCPKQSYDSTCLDRKMKGLPTYETNN